MKYLLPLLLFTFVLGACSRHTPVPADSVTTTQHARKTKSTNAANAQNDSSSSSTTSEDIPLQLSETDAQDNDEDVRTAQGLLLKELQMPATPHSAWKEGVNYKLLSPVQPTSAMPGQVEVTEAFWYGSPHCYVMDQSVETWRKQKASYINFVRLPVMWGSEQRLHARMYYIAELLGKTNELHPAIFQELVIKKSPLNNLDQVQAFFTAHGVSVEDFKRANASPAIEASLKHAQIMGDRYRVTVVPMFIINGKYVTDVVMAGGQAQVLVLINELAAREQSD